MAAATSQPTRSLIVATLAPEADASAGLIEAEEAGVLVIERERIRFAHPLLASVIYGSASHERRRQLHRRLAQVVSDPEQRARHLALSTVDADAATAAELEQVATQAATRGAQQAAAELFSASHRLTPSDQAEDLVRGPTARRLRCWRRATRAVRACSPRRRPTNLRQPRSAPRHTA